MTVNIISKTTTALKLALFFGRKELILLLIYLYIFINTMTSFVFLLLFYCDLPK